ncbi:hypothetical protein GobsT_24150 [Gemmata obscuriglobus]|uniref:Response regulatory domain-containing protein n=1 Tax=Gemmata obscuriglobus TaxID=114 RepID=A0A2Z3GZU1_9BACT|nr:response regulator [Gemmata obscuriglobus]AWM39283.1 hypothetical protein C1280_21365 [Gemmata obscuriglobus]QEG27656.1 hypothetical protein GobsT_24150 [Gemmata obscuriglobus]VTS04835.1 response regulator receiver : Response regulator receiver OS=Planctomyces limnophilus (strain ATCC 43296 / DSM 3776 / IFAM 1008 / 290) GN=Plim_2329 PE=4 SV=1: Response_reg: HATPase_c_2 [Gemmata obscuriglobus UQM 2246]
MTTQFGATLDATPSPTFAPSTTSAVSHNAPTVLLVDDSSVQRRIVHSLLDAAGTWNIIQATDGLSALKMIEQAPPSLVLTDVYMPKMDGLVLVEQIRDRFPSVPVVLMTGHGSEQTAVDALKAGASDYIPKRAMVTDLGRILERVLTNARAESDRVRLLSGMTSQISRFKLENDARLVGPLVAQLRDDLLAVGVCNRHGLTRIAIALEEALLNAIYHGNLEMSSDLKENGDEAFLALARERRTRPPYAERRVHVVARISPAKATFVIEDEGSGFDPASLPDPTSPECVDRPSGRGLLLIRSFMDDVKHNAIGNRITIIKHRSE